MNATENDITNLLELQQYDVAFLNAQRKLEELPQREQLKTLAAKKHAVLEKLAQVAKMHDAARRKLTQVEDETAILLRKKDETQEKIDAAHGDFRAVQSLTRDLEGIAKRLSTLEEEQLGASDKFEQVTGVKKQVEEAVSALDAQALKIRDSYQADAAALNAEAGSAKARSEQISANIDPALLKAYTEAARRGGGIGMARLTENRCSTCRSLIDDNRLLQVKREAPVSRCPSCGRLLVV